MGGRKRERNINVWLPLMRPLLGTWHTPQSCALTGNRTSNPLVHRLALSPLSHTSQGKIYFERLDKCLGDKTISIFQGRLGQRECFLTFSV